ncbi:S49 family peptidase [Anaerolineales bacterium HSG24]|nr:S49 family peptidase [Anaerolineales bacterium HSG24]
MSFSSFLKVVGMLLVFIVAPLLLGWFWMRDYVAPKPAVGIIRMNMDVWAGSNLLLTKQIEAVRDNTSIRAVVVQIDSPGGEVVSGQNMYMELQNLRREMPVVGSIDNMAASGGYYIAMAVDPIFAKPSSNVGNVGVWSFAPPDLGVNDVVLASGPFKMTASSRDEFLRDIDGIKEEFMEIVYSQRGERMKISKSELSQGLLYKGREAIELGLIDQIGTQTEAIEFAAEQVGISEYETIDMLDVVFMDMFGQPAPMLKPVTQLINPDTEQPYIEPWYGTVNPQTGSRNLPLGIYMLYDPLTWERIGEPYE